MPLLRRDSACSFFLFFFFNDTAPTEIYTLSLHDALPIFPRAQLGDAPRVHRSAGLRRHGVPRGDRKSTRLNSSHDIISYAVFCLQKIRSAGNGNTGAAARDSHGAVLMPAPRARSSRGLRALSSMARRRLSWYRRPIFFF